MRLKETNPVMIVTDFIGLVKEETKDENGNVTHTFNTPDTLINKYVKLDDGEVVLTSLEEEADVFDQDTAHDIIGLVQQKTGIENWYYQYVLDEPVYHITEESVTESGGFEVK